ncbi:MAG: nucleotide exchange factor GrpE [Candidatus Nanosyncoccaceae bacterium]|jgi:molecular chaperone GrpE
MSKKNKLTELEQQNGELLLDLQRTRADFENYRKNVEADRQRVKQLAEESMVIKLLPILDDLDRATGYAPKEIADDAWVKGVLSLNKKLAQELAKVGVEKIAVKVGDEFNPELHEAVLVEGEGDKEIIAEVMRPGYNYDGQVLRHVVVKVEKK